MKHTRLFQGQEIRAEDKDGKRTIHGYAAVFDKASQPLGYFRKFIEKIERGAFSKSIENNDVRALWSHNIDLVLGRTGNNTLRLEEDSHGLKFELDLPNTNLGRDTFESISRGDVNGVSFGFNIEAEEWEFSDDEKSPDVHILKRVNLLEISPTAFPAYPDTEVSARDKDQSIVELEKMAEQARAQKNSSCTSTLWRKQLGAEIELIE